MNNLKKPGVKRDIGGLIIRSSAEHSVGTVVPNMERALLISCHSAHGSVSLPRVIVFVHSSETRTTL